ncbi:HIT family protein [hydrothermal vent metagenome]|uniref:HIT family protein n=1 Tax=hydrothermal vent metagenome TaxID=652676 RepID=A0A3B0VDC9_9ZZZZ
MKKLWAPWRMEYVTEEKTDECIFCTAPDKKPEDSLVLFNGALSTVLLNKYPYNNAHLLLAPKKHKANLEDLGVEESVDLQRLMRHSVMVLKKHFKPDGMNIGLNLGSAAGAGITDHLHWHIVPRWEGDTNFMTTVGDISVIPEHILKTQEKLRPFFENIG